MIFKVGEHSSKFPRFQKQYFKYLKQNILNIWSQILLILEKEWIYFIFHCCIFHPTCQIPWIPFWILRYWMFFLCKTDLAVHNSQIHYYFFTMKEYEWQITDHYLPKNMISYYLIQSFICTTKQSYKSSTHDHLTLFYTSQYNSHGIHIIHPQNYS